MLPCIREKNDTVADRPKGCPFFFANAGDPVFDSRYEMKMKTE